MKKLVIGVLFGGCSGEYEVSIQSAYGVITHIDTAKYEPVLIGIDRDGGWHLYRGPVEWIAQDRWFQSEYCTPVVSSPDKKVHGVLVLTGDMILEKRLDAVFPVLHGKNGEEGTVQGVFELAGVPVVGCDLLSSAVCMDKNLAHQTVAQAGVQVPAAEVFGRGSSQEQIKAQMPSYPVFVKPLKGGSSLGITKVFDEKDLEGAISRAFVFDDHIIIEESIDGFEVGCAVLGTEELIIGDVDEIQLSSGFFDYEEKYQRKSSKIYVPARISPDKAAQIKETAEIIYRALGCKGFSRVDMFLTPEGRIVFNEVNTIPGLTEKSRYPNMLKSAGISFDEMVGRLIGMAVSA